MNIIANFMTKIDSLCAKLDLLKKVRQTRAKARKLMRTPADTAPQTASSIGSDRNGSAYETFPIQRVAQKTITSKKPQCKKASHTIFFTFKIPNVILVCCKL